jgi:hypothetical protein
MTIMCFGMCSLIITTAIALSTTNYSIQNLDYLSTKSFYKADGGIDIAYGQVIYEVENAMKSCSESSEEFYSYFLGNNKQNFIKSIENINIDSIRLDIVGNGIYLEESNIKFKISSSYKEGIIEKDISVNFNISKPDGIDSDSKDLIKITDYMELK